MQVNAKLSRYGLSSLEPFLECLGTWDRSLWMILNKITNRSEALEVSPTSVTPVKVAFKTLFPKDLILDLANNRGPRTSNRLQSFYC